MALGLPGRNSSYSLLAISALGFVGFFTFLGFIREKFKRIEFKDGSKVKISRPTTAKTVETQQSATQLYSSLQANGPQGELTTSQIEHLINAIGRVDDSTLENLLVSLGNSCAFTKNQNIIREKGGIARIMQLVHHNKSGVRSRAIQTLSNLAMNLENQKHISVCIPDVQEMIDPTLLSSKSEDELITVLQLLVNLSVVNTWHVDMKKCISYCFNILHIQSISNKVKVNVLRLLVNLSCNKENVEYFLIDKIMTLARFMDPVTTDEDIILRTVVIQINVLQNISDDSLLRERAKYLADGVDGKLDELEKCKNEEIAAKATKMKMLLNNL